MQAVAAHRDYTRFPHICQANIETFFTFCEVFYGAGGIWTHGGLLTLNGFQDRLNKPLWHRSKLARLLPFFPVIDLTTNRQVCQTIQNSRTLAFSLRVIIGTFPYVAETVGFEPTELLIIVRLVSNELLSTTQPSLRIQDTSGGFEPPLIL